MRRRPRRERSARRREARDARRASGGVATSRASDCTGVGARGERPTTPYRLRQRAAREARRRRLTAVLDDAPRRAARLAARGRHGAAVRLLERARRVLLGRGERHHAARAALALGWIFGPGAVAATRSGSSSTRAPSQPTRAGRVARQSRAAIAWTDDDRAAEAEALLRSAQSAATACSTTAASNRSARLALVRTLLWQDRAEEAGAILKEMMTATAGVAVWALAARVHLAAGATSARARGCVDGPATRRCGRVAARNRRRRTRHDAGARSGGRSARRPQRSPSGPGRGCRRAPSADRAPHPAGRLAAYRGDRARYSGDAVSGRICWPRHGGHSPHCCDGRFTPRVEERLRPGHRATLRPNRRSADLRQLLETTQAAPDDLAALQALADALLVRLRALAGRHRLRPGYAA